MCDLLIKVSQLPDFGSEAEMSGDVQPKPKSRWYVVALVLFGLVVAAQVAKQVDAGKPAAPQPPAKSEPPKAPPADHTVPSDMPDLVGEQFVSPHLKDPSSARYRNITYRTRNGLPVLCGEVNARNSFGGYTGFEFFIAIGNVVQIGGRDMHGLWNEFCVKTDADDAKKHHKVTANRLRATR